MLKPFEALATTQSVTRKGGKDPREDAEWIYPIGYESTVLKQGALRNSDGEVSSTILPDDTLPNAHYDDHWTYPLGYEKEEGEDPPHLLISPDKATISQFVNGYALDHTFKTAWKETATAPENPLTPSHFR